MYYLNVVGGVIITNKTRELLANNITYFRHRNGWSQEYFAEIMCSSAAYISQLENAKRKTSTDFIDKLAETLGVEPKELLEKRKVINNKRVTYKE